MKSSFGDVWRIKDKSKQKMIVLLSIIYSFFAGFTIGGGLYNTEIIIKGGVLTVILGIMILLIISKSEKE